MTVLTAAGTVQGDRTLAASFYGWVYTFQGGWTDAVTGLVHFQARDLNTGLGRWIKQDPAGTLNGPNLSQLEESHPITWLDPTGLDKITPGTQPIVIHGPNTVNGIQIPAGGHTPWI